MKDHLVVSFCLLVPVARNSSVYTQASMYVYLLYTLGREAVEKECRWVSTWISFNIVLVFIVNYCVAVLVFFFFESFRFCHFVSRLVIYGRIYICMCVCMFISIHTNIKLHVEKIRQVWQWRRKLNIWRLLSVLLFSKYFVYTYECMYVGVYISMFFPMCTLNAPDSL